VVLEHVHAVGNHIGPGERDALRSAADGIIEWRWRQVAGT
jgi:hypothetical protein